MAATMEASIVGVLAIMFACMNMTNLIKFRQFPVRDLYLISPAYVDGDLIKIVDRYFFDLRPGIVCHPDSIVVVDDDLLLEIRASHSSLDTYVLSFWQRKGVRVGGTVNFGELYSFKIGLSVEAVIMMSTDGDHLVLF